MTKLEFVAENGNIRIDKYIADNEPSLTRTAAAKLIEQGKVFVNENSVGKNYKLKGGDRITLEIPDPVACCKQAERNGCSPGGRQL